MVAEVDVAVVGAIKAVEVLMRRLWALQFAWVLMTICLKRATMVSPLSRHRSMVVLLLIFLHLHRHFKTTSKVIVRKIILQEAEAVREADIKHPLTLIPFTAIILVVAGEVSQIIEETSAVEETVVICTQMVSNLGIIITRISQTLDLLLSLPAICLQNLELPTQA